MNLLIALGILLAIMLSFMVIVILLATSQCDDTEDIVEDEKVLKNTNTCVCCGAEIPEGRQVCKNCENKYGE